MNLTEDIRNSSKDFLLMGVPQEISDSLSIEEMIDSVLEAPDIASDLQKLTNTDLTEEKTNDILLAIKIGANIGVRFGMLSFAQIVADSANDIIQKSEDASE